MSKKRIPEEYVPLVALDDKGRVPLLLDEDSLGVLSAALEITSKTLGIKFSRLYLDVRQLGSAAFGWD